MISSISSISQAISTRISTRISINFDQFIIISRSTPISFKRMMMIPQYTVLCLLLSPLLHISVLGNGFGDVHDAEEDAHPWESEDLAQHHKDERLFDSVVANDLNLVKVSLKIGAHHHHHKNGYTPLMMATWLDHHEICKVLLDAGAHVEQKDKYGRTALTIAAIRGSEHCGKHLIAFDADISTSARDSHHDDVVGHAEKAANHIDAEPSARRLHDFLRKTRDDRANEEKEKKIKEKTRKKKERAEKREAKRLAESKSTDRKDDENKEQNVGL